MVAFLEGVELGTELSDNFLWCVVRQDLHDELLSRHPVLYNLAPQNDMLRKLANDLVLALSAFETLTLADQEVNSGKHLLIGQEVQLAVAFVRLEEQAKVALRSAQEPLIFRVD